MSDLYVPSFTHPRIPLTRTATVTKVLASSNPEQVTTQRRIYKSINVCGFKGNNTANGGNVYVGFDAIFQPYLVSPGLPTNIGADEDFFQKDLSEMYIKGAAGDGVVCQFEEEIVT